MVRRMTASFVRESLPSRAGFSLMETIAVLAIMGILAAAIAPNAIRALDHAAIEAEQTTLATFSASLKQYVIDQRALPQATNWAEAISSYADLSEAAVATNRRSQNRVYIEDPGTDPAERILILSSLRSGLSLPSANTINTAAEFDDIWDTPEGELPSATSWGGWSGWNSIDGSRRYLAIQRINLRPIYANELSTSSISINNTTQSPARYTLYDASGEQEASATLAAQSTVIMQNLRQGQRIDIFDSATGGNLIYSHFVAGQNASFDLANWIP